MPLFIEQYRIVYPNGKFDTTMAIKSHILPIIIKMSNKNLNSLMRVTFKSLDSASQRRLRRLTGQVYDSAIRSNHQKRVYRHGVSAGHWRDLRLYARLGGRPFQQSALRNVSHNFSKIATKSTSLIKPNPRTKSHYTEPGSTLHILRSILKGNTCSRVLF